MAVVNLLAEFKNGLVIAQNCAISLTEQLVFGFCSHFLSVEAVKVRVKSRKTREKDSLVWLGEVPWE